MADAVSQAAFMLPPIWGPLVLPVLGRAQLTEGRLVAIRPLQAEERVLVPTALPATALPATERAPVMEQSPATEQVPAMEQPPVMEQVPAMEQPPATEQVPVTGPLPVMEQPPAMEQPLVTEQVQVMEQVPAMGQPPATEQPAVMEQPPVMEHQLVTERPAAMQHREVTLVVVTPRRAIKNQGAGGNKDEIGREPDFGFCLRHATNSWIKVD
jgi:hypothetical protein